MSAAGAMRNFDPHMSREEYMYSHQDNKNQHSLRSETDMDIKDIFSDLIQRQREEMKERIRTGTSSEPSYQIGAASFTEREWTKLIKSVDAVQEEMRKAAERERELEKETQEIKKEEKEKRCIIVYDADGIRCIEAVSGICRWFIRFTDHSQYDLVQEIMQGVKEGTNSSPVFQEDFWKNLF